MLHQPIAHQKSNHVSGHAILGLMKMLLNLDNLLLKLSMSRLMSGQTRKAAPLHLALFFCKMFLRVLDQLTNCYNHLFPSIFVKHRTVQFTNDRKHLLMLLIKQGIAN